MKRKNTFQNVMIIAMVVNIFSHILKPKIHTNKWPIKIFNCCKHNNSGNLKTKYIIAIKK